MEDDVDGLVDLQVLRHVVAHEHESFVTDMCDVQERSGVEVVDTDDTVIPCQKIVAEVRAEETRTPRDDSRSHRVPTVWSIVAKFSCTPAYRQGGGRALTGRGQAAPDRSVIRANRRGTGSQRSAARSPTTRPMTPPTTIELRRLFAATFDEAARGHDLAAFHILRERERQLRVGPLLDELRALLCSL